MGNISRGKYDGIDKDLNVTTTRDLPSEVNYQNPVTFIYDLSQIGYTDSPAAANSSIDLTGLASTSVNLFGNIGGALLENEQLNYLALCISLRVAYANPAGDANRRITLFLFQAEQGVTGNIYHGSKDYIVSPQSSTYISAFGKVFVDKKYFLKVGVSRDAGGFPANTIFYYGITGYRLPNGKFYS